MMKKIITLLITLILISNAYAFTIYTPDGTPINRYRPSDAPAQTYYDHYYANGNYQIENPLYREGECNSLDIYAKNMTVKKGETNHDYFQLKNYSSMPFYIDQINILEQSPAYDAIPVAGVSAADPLETAGFEIAVEAYGTETDEIGTNYLEVVGHYPNGQNCVLKERFLVYIDTTEPKLCANYDLDVPNKIVSTASNQTFNIFITNPFNNALTLKLDAKNATVSPQTIVVTPNSQVTKKVQVTNFNGEEAKVYYETISNECNLMKKVTLLERPKEQKIIAQIESTEKIVLLSYAEKIGLTDTTELPVVLTNHGSTSQDALVTVKNLPDGFTVRANTAKVFPNEEKTVKVEIKYNGNEIGIFQGQLVIDTGEKEIKRDIIIELQKEDKATLTTLITQYQDEKGSYDVKAIVKNNLDGVLRGHLQFNIPQEWEVTGDPVVELGPQEEIITSFLITPTQKPEADYELEAQFVTQTGEVIQSMAPQNAEDLRTGGIGFVTLGNAVGLGILIVLLGLAVFIYRKEQENPDLEELVQVSTLPPQKTNPKLGEFVEQNPNYAKEPEMNSKWVNYKPQFS